MDPIIVIPAFVAIGVVALIAGGVMYYRELAGTRNLEDRLGRLTGQSVPTLESAGILKEPMFPDDAKSFIERLLPQLPNLERYFEQADFKMPPSRFWLVTAIAAIVGAGIPALLGAPIYLPILSAVVVGVLPITYVHFKRKQRLAKFGSQLCEGLELVARALRAGHSLAAAMHTVAEEMPNPISKEFGRVYEEQNLGLSLEQAMRNIAERVPNLDLKFFVTAVIVQRQTGGDLAEILDKIGYVIRERFKILGMVQALTGEGRISGVVLIALPFALLFMLMQTSPKYVALLWERPEGRMMSGVGIVMLIIGALVIRKIVNIKV